MQLVGAELIHADKQTDRRKDTLLLLLLCVGLAEIPPIALQPSRPFVL
jgi:hypothetical protein